MTELEKIEYTKGFVDKLAEGINPIDGTPIAEGDLLNNVRISRCMYYVSDILRRVIENGGTESKKPARRGRAPFALDSSARRELTPADEPLRISQVTSLINERVDPETMKSLRSGVITRWLLGIGALEQVQLPSGKTIRLPTPQGRGLGLITQEFQGENSVYSVVLYKPEAQQFIFDNIDAIEQLNREKAAAEKRRQALEPRRMMRLSALLSEKAWKNRDRAHPRPHGESRQRTARASRHRRQRRK